MDGDVVTGCERSLAPDDERVPGQKRSLEPVDDDDDDVRKKLKTDDCRFCTFDNKVQKLKDPRQWRILPAVVYDVLALITSGGKRVDPAAGKQPQHHRVDDADNRKEESTIFPKQNDKKEFVKITENGSPKENNECILISNEKPFTELSNTVEIHSLESLKPNIVQMLDNLDNSPDKANVEVTPKKVEVGFTDNANNVEVTNKTSNTPITLYESTEKDNLEAISMELEDGFSDTECNVEVKNKTSNTPITLVENAEKDDLEAKPKELEDCVLDNKYNVEVINKTSYTSNTLVKNIVKEVVQKFVQEAKLKEVEGIKCMTKKSTSENAISSEPAKVGNKYMAKKSTSENIISSEPAKVGNKYMAKKSTSENVISSEPAKVENKYMAKKSTSENVISSEPAKVENKYMAKKSTSENIISSEPTKVENKYMAKKSTSENVISSEPAKVENKYMAKKSTSENVISSEPAKVENKYMAKKSTSENIISSEPAKCPNISTSTKNISTDNFENTNSKLKKLLSLNKRSQLLELSSKLCLNGISEIPTSKPLRCICRYCMYVDNIPVEQSAVHQFASNYNSNFKTTIPKNKIFHKDMYSSNITLSSCPTCESKGIYNTNDCSCVDQSHSKIVWVQELKTLMTKNEMIFEDPKTKNVSNYASTSFASIKGVVNKAVHKATDRIKSHLKFCNNCKKSNDSRKFGCKCNKQLYKKDKYNEIPDKYHYYGRYKRF